MPTPDYPTNTTPDAVPNVWVVYLASRDAAATVAAAEAAGMRAPTMRR